MSDEGKQKPGVAPSDEGGAAGGPGEADKAAKKPPPPPGGGGPGVPRASAAAALVGKAAGDAPPPPPKVEPVPAPVSAPPQPHRPPMPTLGEPAPAPKKGTLRPPGAVPPPPRRIPPTPAPPVIVDGDKPPAADAPPAEGRARVSTEPSPDAPAPPGAPTAKVEIQSPPEAKTNPVASDEPVEAPDATPLPSFDLESAAHHAPPPPPMAAAPVQPEPPQPKQAQSSSALVIVIGGVVVLLLLVVVVLLVVRDRSAPEPVAVTPAKATAGGKTPAAKEKSCTIAKAAQKLSAKANIRVQPHVTISEGSSRAAVGFAETRTSAIGMTIDPVTLDVDQPFRQRGGRKIIGVVPSTAGGKLSFVVDRDSGALNPTRSVDVDPLFAVGRNAQGLARVVSAEAPEILWEIPKTSKITVPSVATVPGFGHVVAVRVGGQSGKVHVGWLGMDGVRSSDLVPLDVSGFVGTPSVSASANGILVGFAHRANADSPWGITLATAEPGKQPSETKRFSIPPGGPGTAAISPIATALPDDQWLLQWTEGTSGNNRIRAQTLGKDLAPVAGAVNLSPPDANAGKGVVWARDKNAITLFFVKTATGHELWGVALKCL